MHGLRGGRFRLAATLAAVSLLAAVHPARLHAAEPAAAAAAPTPAPAPAKVAPAAVEPSALPAAAFASLPFVEDAHLSPNGKRLVGNLAIEGKQLIAIINLFDRQEKSDQIGVPEGTEVTWTRWVGDDYVLIGLSAQEMVEGERWYINRMVGVERATGKVTKLMWDLNGQNASDVLWIPRDGSHEILVAAQNSIYTGEDFWPAVYRLDVANGHKTVVVPGRTGVMSWYVDGTGYPRAGINYNDTTRTGKLLYRGERERPFREIDRADGHKRESLIDPILFLPGTDYALVEHMDDKGNDCIFEVDLTTQKDLRLVYQAPTGSEIEDTILNRDGNALAGVRTSSPVKPVVWFDPPMAELQANFDKAVPGSRVRVISFSQDLTKMLVTVDRADTPGAIYYYNVDGGRLNLVSKINEELGTRPLSPVKLVTYAARDGTQIEAVLTLPLKGEAKALPFIVMPHGGPWAQDRADYDYWAQFLASRGYVVLQPNFRGSTGYGLDFLRKGEGQLGLAMQDDVTDGVKWAIKQGIADPARTCIVGASYGGYAAMWGIAKDPDLYRCAISIAGVASLRREVNDFNNTLYEHKYTDDWQRMTPDFPAVSPVNAIARIKTPLLLIHGKKDVTVDFSQSAMMFSRMKAAGKTVEFVPVPLADHYFTRQADRLTLLTAFAALSTARTLAVATSSSMPTPQTVWPSGVTHST
jgi:dipeptidyl aminopeptidase/acylaminoacyl peptidase